MTTRTAFNGMVSLALCATLTGCIITRQRDMGTEEVVQTETEEVQTSQSQAQVPPPATTTTTGQQPPAGATGESTQDLLSQLRDDLLFEVDSAEIEPQLREDIEKLGQLLAQDPANKIKIEGYADSSGPTAYNEGLSKRRAESVREILTSQGVRPDQLQLQAFGENDPVASNNTEDGRKRNRRVEIEMANGPSG